MKIYNDNKVYVQVKDVNTLVKYEKNIPYTIIGKLIETINKNNSNIDDGFIVFDKKNELDYFNSTYWIIDYKKIRELDDADLRKIKSILNVKKNEALLDSKDKEFELMNYKMKQIDELIKYRKSEISIPFPEEIDEDGFTLNSDYTYKIKGTLDPTKIVLFRKDGKPLKDNEEIPREFIQTGLSIAMIQNTRRNHLMGNYSVEHKLSDDNKYLITKMNFVPIKEKEDYNNKSKIKNLFKKLFIFEKSDI